MGRIRYVEPCRRDEILVDAAEKETPVVVTVRCRRRWRTHKTHLLSEFEPAAYLTMQGPLRTEAGVETTVAPGEQVGVAFRRGHKKCMFGAVVREAHDFPESMVVDWPAQVQELQRRVYHRSQPPRGTTIEVSFWAAGSSGHAAASPPPADAYGGRLVDLSAGGLRLETDQDAPLEPGQAVVCRFAHQRGAPPIALEATFRHRLEGDRGRVSVGLQFVGLEATPAGRKCLVRLAKVVSEFQRAEYDRCKPGRPRACQP